MPHRPPANPFSTRFWTPGVLPFRFEDDTRRDDVLARVDRLIRIGGVMQVLGPHGSGKSTLLGTVARHFAMQGLDVRLVGLDERRRCRPADFFSAISPGSTLLLIDGHEQLSPWNRWTLRTLRRRAGAALVWTTHRPAWGVPVLYRTRPSGETFRTLARNLAEPSGVSLDDDLLDDVFERSGGNFRDGFFELYDRFSERF